MTPKYLNNLPEINYALPIRTNHMELPIDKMAWEDFEKLCLRMVEYIEGFEIASCEILGRKGQKQDGIDIYARKESNKYYTFQCKRYKSIKTKDLENIISEFRRGEWFSKSLKFYICVSANFADVRLQKKFEEIRIEYKNIHNKELEIWDKSFINRKLKTYPQIVYDFFGDEWCKAFCGEDAFRQLSKTDIRDLEKSFRKASLFLSNVKNYFEKKTETHVDRKESKTILNWVNSDLIYPNRNLLVVEGERGMGKSVILKDVYDELLRRDYTVLGIKADKYYALAPKELENKIFLDAEISFSNIIRTLNTHKKSLIIIIDQLDALSQTLSSNRQYIQTYNRIINELLDEKNIRIIISSRSYDLKYDAELSIYKSSHFKNVKLSFLSENEVLKTLRNFNINYSQKKFIQLLRTPSHLEIFCKLPDKQKLKLNTLSTIKDLYDTLWEELVVKQENNKLSEVLYDIADKMYNKQQITIKNHFSNGFQKELKYLLSNQLIISDNNTIQFFHQTFYDYCFSRQFVEKGNSIYKYLNENEQNLEIRSIIKMVFEYLREYDHKKYILQTRAILKSQHYRFHIKSLVINNLGILENPSNQEKDVINRIVLNSKLYEDIFIHSIQSKIWTNHLITTGIMEKLLFWNNKTFVKVHKLYKEQSVVRINWFERRNPEKIIEHNKNALWIFLRNNINYLPLKIFQYLENLPEFEDKDHFIKRLLLNLDDWEDENLLFYFEKYITYIKESERRDNFWFYQKLEKIFKYHKNYVFDLLSPIFADVFSYRNSWHDKSFSYDQKELLKNLYEHSPEDTFLFILRIYKKILLDNSDTFSFEEIDCPFYKSSKFSDGLSLSNDAHLTLEEFLVKHLKSKYKQKSYIIAFYEKHKNSNSIFILRIIALLFNTPGNSLYIEQVFEFINIISHKNGLNTFDDKFQLFLRRLIATYFPYFSKKGKIEVAEILLKIKSPNEPGYTKYKDDKGNDRTYFYGFGKKQYYFISHLPIQEINKIPQLKKTYQEFFRRFGSVDSNKAHDISSSSSYGVGAPLPQKAYDNMDLKNWRKSMSKFNDTYQEGFGPRGGKREHSRAFGESVKTHPEKYYGFIQELFYENNISTDYISEGLDGLIEARYNPKKVKFLHDMFLKLDLNLTNTLDAIRQSGYLIKNNLVDETLINFLSDNAKHHHHPQKPMNENDPLFDSMNTVRGAAIHKIISCYKHKRFEEIIFETAEKAISDPQISVKVAVMIELAYLNYLDLNRSFEIFMKLVRLNNSDILKNSYNTSQYFNVKFHKEMYLYFQAIIDHEELHEDGNVIVLSWLDEKINDKRLYGKFVKSSETARLCALKIAEANLFNKRGTLDKKSISILYQFLNEDGEDFASAYSGLVLRKFNNQNFPKLLPFLLKYSKSKPCRAQPSYFLQLLMSCTKDYPKECLTLLENMNFDRIPDIQTSGYYSDEPVQLILSIYSKLNLNLKKNRKLVKKSLNIFDSMLKHNHLRISVNQAIKLIK